jgi:hypothetical protein
MENEAPKRVFSLVAHPDTQEIFVEEGPYDRGEFEDAPHLWTRVFSGGFAMVSRIRCPREKERELHAAVRYPEVLLVQCIEVAVRRGYPQVAYRAAWQLARQNHALLAARVAALILTEAVYHPVSDVVAFLALAWGLSQKLPSYEEVKVVARVARDLALCPRAEQDGVVRLCLLRRPTETFEQLWRQDGERVLRCDPTFGTGLYLLGECVQRLDRFWSGAGGDPDTRLELYAAVQRWATRFSHPRRGDDWHELLGQCYPSYPDRWWKEWHDAFSEEMEAEDRIAEACNDASHPAATALLVERLSTRREFQHITRMDQYREAIAEFRRRRSEKKAISAASSVTSVLEDWQGMPVRAKAPHLFAAWEVVKIFLDPADKKYAYPKAWEEEKVEESIPKREKITAYFQPNRKKNRN